MLPDFELRLSISMYLWVTEGTPDSENPSVVDEKEDKELEEEEEEDYGEGLPSPPLDELAFFAAPTSGIELSQVRLFYILRF